jgi:hypothetical protein
VFQTTAGTHRRRVASLLSLFLVVLLVPALAVACGGDDSSSKATPTRAPATAGGGDYKTKAQNAATKLGKQADALVKDMQTAQMSQSDPKWNGILTSDADLIVTAANELKALTPPAGSLADVHAQFVKAADRLIEAAGFMKKSVDTGDVAAGTQAYLGLTQGNSMLTDALAALK